MVSGTKSGITTAVQITTALTPCFRVVISNPAAGSDSVWIGDANVAIGKGTEIPKGTSASFDVPEASSLYAVATSGTQSVGFNVYR